MRKEDIHFASATEIEARYAQARDFYVRILKISPDLLHLVFSSNETHLSDFDIGTEEESRKIIFKEYGIYLSTEQLKAPLWQLLDVLYPKNQQQIEG
jgi:hypothetical protein